MIFVASQADASALNLGKISIKTINDVSQETYDVIEAYGNKSLTDDQTIALDDFLVAFNNASWKSKVGRLVIPVLGNDNNSPATGVLYGNLYDIVTKKAGKLVSNGNSNGDTGSPAIIFKDGIFVNNKVNDANYTPYISFTNIPFNPRDLMFGCYGTRGTDENNASNHEILCTRTPEYACSTSPNSIQVGAASNISKINTIETNKGDDFGILASYNYSLLFFKAYKNSVLVSASTVNDTYKHTETNNGFGFGLGVKLEDNLGNKIKIMTLGSSMNEKEMQEYDKLLQTLLSYF